jgi:hypothetical protein
MQHDESEHKDIPFYVHNKTYGANDFPKVELLPLQLQKVAADLNYKGVSTSPYLVEAFKAAYEYGLQSKYLLSNNHVYVDITPDYYPDVIEVLKNSHSQHPSWLSVENDLALKRFALQLDLYSGEWSEAYQYATETTYSSEYGEHVASHEPHLSYYLISILLKVLKHIERRDQIELINKEGKFDYHLGYQRYDNYSPKQFGIVLRALSLSNKSSIPVFNADHEGRVSIKNAIAIIDAVDKIQSVRNALQQTHDYKIYSEWLDSPITDTIVMINNLLTIWNPYQHELHPESGEVERMANFINKYGFEKAILAVHNHGYTLEALEEFDGMPKQWVKDIVQEAPYDFQGMLEIIRGS